ncbi:hypothetical protein [Lentilactobacillus hilgardii]|uniref:hypothetical protein n=1 Tax=Lentilactobacillus hilgardii TaxID=1588 RepID=UPI0021A95D16|nr:hypothetical protein [Lentilactobacillus hilgardii]MCT3390360.1 hypothetical protein [Lentilactobacillus hilgardii]
MKLTNEDVTTIRLSGLNSLIIEDLLKRLPCLNSSFDVTELIDILKLVDPEKMVSISYQKGYDDGLVEGRNDGYDDGYADGSADAEDGE